MVTLKVEGEAPVPAPREQQVVDELTWLLFPKRKFAILEEGERFLQVYLKADGSFVVEYSDGDPGKMFKFEPATLQQATDAMLSFLKGDDYRAALPFQPFTF